MNEFVRLYAMSDQTGLQALATDTAIDSFRPTIVDHFAWNVQSCEPTTDVGKEQSYDCVLQVFENLSDHTANLGWYDVMVTAAGKSFTVTSVVCSLGEGLCSGS